MHTTPDLYREETQDVDEIIKQRTHPICKQFIEHPDQSTVKQNVVVELTFQLTTCNLSRVKPYCFFDYDLVSCSPLNLQNSSIRKTKPSKGQKASWEFTRLTVKSLTSFFNSFIFFFRLSCSFPFCSLLSPRGDFGVFVLSI